MWGLPKIIECLQDSQCRQLGRRAALCRQRTQAQGGHAACPPPLQQQVSSPKAQTGLLLPYLAASHPPAHARARRPHRKGEKRQSLSPFPTPRTTRKARPTWEESSGASERILVDSCEEPGRDTSLFVRAQRSCCSSCPGLS